MSRRSSRSLDDLRSEHPELGFAVYAITPGEPVTLEIHTADDVFTFRGPTEAAVIDQAFPPESIAPPEPPPPPPSIFD